MDKRRYQVYLLYIMGFVDLFAVGVTVPLIVPHMKSLGSSHFVVGMMGSFYAGVQLFSGPFIGSLSDLKGRKQILIFSLVCCSLGYFLLGIFSSVLVLLGLRLLIGLYKQTQMLTKAMVADVCPSSEQSGVYGRLAAIAGLGITIGPVVGGHILEDIPGHGFTVACTLTSLLFVLNAGIARTMDNREDNAKQVKKHKEELSVKGLFKIVVESVKMSLKDLLSVDWTCYWDIFLFKAIVSFGMGCYFANYSVLLKMRYGLSPKWLGYTISFQGVVTSVCSFFIEYISNIYKADTDYSLRNLHGFILMVISILGMIYSSSYGVFLLCLVPLAICNAAMRQIGLEMIINKSSSRHRGSVIGASNSMRSIAGILAPMVAGYLSDLFNVESILYASLVSCIFGTVMAAYVRRRNDRIKKVG